MTYSLAAVSFLNTVPLVEQMAGAGPDVVKLRLELPSRLAALLESGAADAALVPVVEVFRGRAAALVPGTGIACRGPVDTVKLFHGGPPSSLKRVLTDRGSRTSVALLNILLREEWGATPEFTEVEPSLEFLPAAGDGLLVIGDRCFGYERHLQFLEGHGVIELDLGQAWLDLTGLPFVFAMWAVSPAFLARASTSEVAGLVALLTDARDHGLAHLDDLAAREAARGALGHKGEATAAAVAYYFRESLRYRLGDEEMKGLALFHELCVKHGVVPAGPPPLIL